MNIRYHTSKLEKTVECYSAIKRNYGLMAKKIDVRLQQFSVALNLEELTCLPGIKCHELHADRAGKLAVHISPNHRIIIEPDHDPLPEKEDGGLDWKQVTAIVIREIAVDYH